MEDHRASPRAGRVTLSYVCPHCHRHPLEDYLWWVPTKHGGGQYDWRNPNTTLIIQDSTVCSEAKAFSNHVPLHGVCENLLCSLIVCESQQLGSYSAVRVMVKGSSRTKHVKDGGEL